MAADGLACNAPLGDAAAQFARCKNSRSSLSLRHRPTTPSQIVTAQLTNDARDMSALLHRFVGTNTDKSGERQNLA